MRLLLTYTLLGFSITQAQTSVIQQQPPTGVAALKVEKLDNRILPASQSSKTPNGGLGSISQTTSEDASSAVPLGQNYVLGPGDQVSLQVEGLDNEFADENFRIDLHGDINLPMIGRFQAAGLTLNQFEDTVRTRMQKFVKEPDVVASITEFHSQPVSVLGSVNSPGVHQLQGHKTLYEVLSSAGGLRQDAGNSIRLTREMRWGKIPLPSATEDSTQQYSTVVLPVKGTLNASDPAQNIAIMPGDVITVPQGEVVYAVGSVNKPGGFLLGENQSLSALQVVSLAEGLDHLASASKARVLRAVAGSSTRIEIPVDLKRLMAGQMADVPMQANDILFVPTSASKTVSKRTIDAAIQVASGIVMYGRY